MSNERKVIVEGTALEQLRNERMKKVDRHLDVLGTQTSIANNDLDMILKAAIEHHGLPNSEAAREAMFTSAQLMADLLTKTKLNRYNEEIKRLCQEQNIHDFPDEVVWGAARAGVTL